MRKLSLAAALLLSASAAQAATFVETTDFASQPLDTFLSTSANVFDVSGIGSHSIQGSLEASCVLGTCTVDDSIDTFSINVGADRLITSLILTISDTFSGFSSSGIAPDPVTTTSVISAFPTAFGINTITGDGSFDYSQGFTGFYTPGVYSYGVGISASGIIVDISANWRLDITTIDTSATPVPLPASALFLGAGLAGLGLTRRKRT